MSYALCYSVSLERSTAQALGAVYSPGNTCKLQWLPVALALPFAHKHILIVYSIAGAVDTLKKLFASHSTIPFHHSSPLFHSTILVHRIQTPALAGKVEESLVNTDCACSEFSEKSQKLYSSVIFHVTYIMLRHHRASKRKSHQATLL